MTTPSPTAPASPKPRAELRERVQGLKLPEPESSKPGGRLPWLLCIVLLGLAGWFAALWRLDADDLFFRSTRPAALPSADVAATTANPVAASPGRRSEISGETIALESKGYIIPAHQILVSPKVSGMITRLCIEEGQRVQKGDILAEIEEIEYQAEADRAQAFRDLTHQRLLELERGNRPEEIEQARAELAESNATLAELDDLYQRQQSLKKSGASTEQAFIQAERRMQAQRQRVANLEQGLKLLEDGPRIERIEAARAELRQVEADLVRSKWRLENCTIRAPISGTILKKNAEEGNIVNAVAFNGSFSLCDMADLADLEVSLDIQEREVSKVFRGQRVEVRAEAFPERKYAGVVDRLMPIADRAKGAIPVRVKVRVPKEEEGVFLKPEMGAIVTFFGAPGGNSDPAKDAAAAN